MIRRLSSDEINEIFNVKRNQSEHYVSIRDYEMNIMHSVECLESEDLFDCKYTASMSYYFDYFHSSLYAKGDGKVYIMHIGEDGLPRRGDLVES